MRLSRLLPLLALLATSAEATVYRWQMTATEDQVNDASTLDGSTDSAATGEVELRWDTDSGRLEYDVSWRGLESDLTAIHVQGPNVPDEQTNPFLWDVPHFWDVFGSLSDVIAAGVDRRSDRVVADVDLAELVGASDSPFDPGVVMRFMLEERGYVNIRSQMWASGEIRAGLVLVESQPRRTRDHGRCAEVAAEELAAVHDAASRAVVDCLEHRETVDACLAELDEAMTGPVARTERRFVAACHGFGRRGLPRYPFFGVPDAGRLGDLASGPVDRLVNYAQRPARELPGNLFNSGENVPFSNELYGGAAGRCQRAVVRQVARCQRRSMEEIAMCAAAGAVGLPEPAVYPGAELPFDDDGDLVPCLDYDPQGRVARSCDEGIERQIAKKCEGLDVAELFPGHSASSDLASRLTEEARLSVCYWTSDALGFVSPCNPEPLR